jgi:hypothetical protein
VICDEKKQSDVPNAVRWKQSEREKREENREYFATRAKRNQSLKPFF